MISPTPRFVEAYPVLRAAGALAGLAAGTPCCIWRREDGVLACVATLREERQHVLYLDWIVHELPHLTQRRGEAHLKLVHHSIGKNARPLFSCVSCGRAVSKLVLAPGRGRASERPSWKCQSCHKLKYMGSLGGQGSSASREQAALQQEVGHGRPKGMWESTYAEKLERLKQLEHSTQVSFAPTDRRVADPTWSTSARADTLEREPDVVLSRDSFPYLEAYPRLYAVEVRHALSEGRSLCVWTAGGAVIGNAELRLAEPQLEMRYALQRTREHAGAVGELSIGLLLKGSDVDNKRWLFGCPGCGEARSSLILVGARWGCRTCHNLTYRSALVGTSVRRAANIVQLQATLETLRSAGARRARIARAKAALEAELAKIDVARPQQANSAFQHVVRASWIEGEFAEDGWSPLLDQEAAPPIRGIAPGSGQVQLRGMSDQVHVPPQPLAAPAELRYLQGRPLFAEEPLDRHLQGLFESNANWILRQWTERMPPRREMAEEIAHAARVRVISLSRSGHYFIDDEALPEHRGRPRSILPTHMTGTIEVAFRGEGQLFGFWPKGYEVMKLKGHVTGKTIALSALVPIGGELQPAAVIETAAKLLRQILSAQRKQINEYHDSLPTRAQALVAEFRARKSHVARAEKMLRTVKF